MGYEGADVTSVVQDKAKLLVFVNMTTKLLVAIEKDTFDLCMYRLLKDNSIPGEAGRKIL
jgi:hypothetical protein